MLLHLQFSLLRHRILQGPCIVCTIQYLKMKKTILSEKAANSYVVLNSKCAHRISYLQVVSTR